MYIYIYIYKYRYIYIYVYTYTYIYIYIEESAYIKTASTHMCGCVCVIVREQRETGLRFLAVNVMPAHVWVCGQYWMCTRESGKESAHARGCLGVRACMHACVSIRARVHTKTHSEPLCASVVPRVSSCRFREP